MALAGFRGPLGSAPVLALLYVLFLALVYAYGLVIWDTPLQKGVTLLAAIGITVGTILVIRRGMLRRRTVIEVRDDENDPSPPRYAAVHGGRPLAMTVSAEDGSDPHRMTAAEGPLPPFSQLRAVRFELPETDAADIKVWIHRVTSIGESVGIPAVVSVKNGSDARVIDLGLSNGWTVVPIGPGATQVSISLRPTDKAEGKVAGQRVGGDR
jgi:hypothetical protein